jgi:hypothetical protein
MKMSAVSTKTSVHLTEDEWRRLKAPARRERIFRVASYFSPLLLLLLWELSSQFNLIDRRFFPAPSAIADTAWRMIVSLELFQHIGATLRRVGIGYLMGAVPGIVIGLILGLSQPVRRVLGPIFAALYPVPKIAILPLILLIFGVGDASKFVVIAIGVFFLMFYNTMGGVMQTPQKRRRNPLPDLLARGLSRRAAQHLHRAEARGRLLLHHHRGRRVPRRAQWCRLLHLGILADLCRLAHVRRHRGDLGHGLPHHSGARGAGAAVRALGQALTG